jgi:restriction system protein
MAVPGYEKFMLPMMEIVSDQREHAVSEVRDKLAEYFQLAEEDLRELLPSGKQTVFYNRVGWAKTYLQKAKLLESLRRGYFQITKRGLEVLKEKPQEIDRKYLEQFDEFREFVGLTDNTSIVVTLPDNKEKTPLEVLEAAYEEIEQILVTEILEKLKNGSPSFFERLVVDLLLKMGYGGSRADAGHAIGKSGDEGIDGIIKEDKLGLDIIYIQAKRWQNPVGRPEIQKFVGALVGQRAKKGVFITTSTFTKEAVAYAESIENKVVLIDCYQLARYMIQHNLGVSTSEVYEVKRIDTDYFEE